MIKGESLVTMMMVSYCISREHSVKKIAHELKLSTEQVERLVEKNAFTQEDVQTLCDICGYVVALVPKSAFGSVPLVS